MNNRMNNTDVQTINEIEALRQENVQIRVQFQRERRRFRIQAGLAFLVVLGAAFLSAAQPSARANGGDTLNDIRARLTALELKTKFISIDTVGDMHITGTNLHIENGLGATFTTNSLGNLIIGYNGYRANQNERGGSHNLILGDLENYKSYGGIVAGSTNTISAPYATVTGGFGNVAAGGGSTVSGGWHNTAGGLNQPDGDGTSVSGGQLNVAKETRNN